MRFVCRLFHLKPNFYCRAVDGVRSGGEFVNSANNIEIIMFRAAPLTVDFSLNQSSDQSETSLWVTREVFHSTLLGFSPFLSNSSLPNADNFAEFIGDEIRWFHLRKKKKKKSFPRLNKSARIQRVEVSCCSHFNDLNV